ncbi:MAG: inositol-3-phosphate synthase, partial [Dehalococcoidales bacterium]|nr:inositol-3-phosphate synthase [Dehalococcoidales bacterium]
DVPLILDMKLEVWDSPNSAGVVIDAVRCCKLALDKGIKGELTAPSSYFMKSPPIQYTDDEAHRLMEEFIKTNALTAAPAKPLKKGEAGK